MLIKFDKVVFKEDCNRFKKGDTAFYVTDVISSGYRMCVLIETDDYYYRFLKEEGAYNLESYLNKLRKDVLFMNEDGWHNRFTTHNVYPEYILSLSDIEKQKEKAQKTLKKAEEDLALYNELSESFKTKDIPENRKVGLNGSYMHKNNKFYKTK